MEKMVYEFRGWVMCIHFFDIVVAGGDDWTKHWAHRCKAKWDKEEEEIVCSR